MRPLALIVFVPVRAFFRPGLGVWLISFFLALSCAEAVSAGPSASDIDRIAGDYQLQGVMETASALRLSVDGTYKFFLSYGSVDEMDEGKWHVDGSSVVLKSTMPADDPQFVFLRSGKDEAPGVRVLFEGKSSTLATFYTQVFLLANGQLHSANEAYETYKKSGSARAPIQKISLSLIGALRIYGVFEFKPVDPTHNYFVFRLDAGNFGYVRFNGTRMRMGDGELYLKTPATQREFKYVRVKGSR